MNNDTRVIELTQGFVTIVDAADFEFLSQWKWYYADGYAVRSFDGKRRRIHHLLLSAPEGMVVDHVNRDRLDNRRCNLRVCTPQQNKRNRTQSKKSSKNASRYKGVFWLSGSRVKCWNPCISVNGKKLSLGCYLTEEEAAIAYDAAARFYYGEFASTNFEGTEALDYIRIRQLARS